MPAVRNGSLARRRNETQSLVNRRRRIIALVVLGQDGRAVVLVLVLVLGEPYRAF
jgi:hypothetical protein